MWPQWEDRGRQRDPAAYPDRCQSPIDVSSLNDRDGYNELLITSFSFFFFKEQENSYWDFPIFLLTRLVFFLKYLANIKQLHIWMQLTLNNRFNSLIFEKNSKFSLSLKALLSLVCIFPRLSAHFPRPFWQQYTYPCNQRSMGNSGNIQLCTNI